MEESRAELDFLVKEALRKWTYTQKEEDRVAYDVLLERLTIWKQKFRGTHLNWIYEKESLGHETHRWSLAYGPQHPCSYLLYNDGGNLIFPRDQSDRYSSYTFWLQHLTDEQPIEHLGKDFFSAKELHISPEVIGEYYQLQQVFLKHGFTGERDVERLSALRTTIQEAFSKIDTQSPVK